MLNTNFTRKGDNISRGSYKCKYVNLKYWWTEDANKPHVVNREILQRCSCLTWVSSMRLMSSVTQRRSPEEREWLNTCCRSDNNSWDSRKLTRVLLINASKILPDIERKQKMQEIHHFCQNGSHLQIGWKGHIYQQNGSRGWVGISAVEYWDGGFVFIN